MKMLKKNLFPLVVFMACYIVFWDPDPFGFDSYNKDLRKDQFMETCLKFFEAKAVDCEEFHSKYSGFMNR